MAKPNVDGVIQAVRYDPDGRVAWVRAYLRRGPTWSDTLLLDRETLINELKSGKKFFTGVRIPLLAGTFETRKPLQLVEKNGKTILVAGEFQAEMDHLEGVPLV